MGSGGGCYSRHSGGGGVAKSVSVCAVAKTCTASLFFFLFSKGTDGQSQHDKSLEREKQNSFMLKFLHCDYQRWCSIMGK
jgi:hypothetical protein